MSIELTTKQKIILAPIAFLCIIGLDFARTLWFFTSVAN